MLRRSILSFSLLLGVVFATQAQFNKDIFPLKQQFKNGGFYIFPHANYSIGNKEDGELSFSDTTYSFEVTGQGKFGYGLELGWFHSFEKPSLIHYVEGGVSYRLFKGDAEHDGVLSTPTGTTNFKSDNTFDAQLLVASFRLVNVQQLKKYSFFSTALGFNYNYKIGEKYTRSSAYPLTDEKFIPESMAQVHLQFGIGFLESEKFLFVPTIETPILTAYPTDDLNPAFSFFSAKYHPIMIGLKILFLREDPINCNAPSYEGDRIGM